MVAQADAFPNKEVGFNVGFLVTNLLRNERPSNLQRGRNFMLTYKKHYLKNIYFRYGISFLYNKTFFDSNNNNDLKLTQTDFRIGYEYKHRIDKKWSINRGTDIITNYFSLNRGSAEDNNRQLQIGLVPFLGIQYNINPRINLSTETAIGFFYVNNKNVFNSNLFFADRIDSEGTQITIFTPQELILSISF